MGDRKIYMRYIQIKAERKDIDGWDEISILKVSQKCTHNRTTPEGK